MYVDNKVRIGKTIDQQFLREIIYPLIYDDVIIHDSALLESESLLYPEYEISEIERTPFFHIGLIDANINKIEIQVKNDANKIKWYLIDENDEVVCSYIKEISDSERKKGVVVLNLPYKYSEKIKDKIWSIYKKYI